MVMDDWTRANPGCKDPNHGKNDLYLNCIQASCGPLDATEEARSVKKISKNLANHTIIKKMVEYKFSDELCQEVLNNWKYLTRDLKLEGVEFD